jgi:hypothetical protein
VKGLWGGLWPLTEEDWIGTCLIEPEFKDTSVPATLIIGQETFRLMADSADQHYHDLRAEFGWDGFAIYDEQDKRITMETDLSGATFRVFRLVNRPQLMRISFQGQQKISLEM